MAAAARRDVGEDLAAAAGHEPGEGLGLSADPGRGASVTFTIVIDSSIVNVTAGAGGVKVERQHPPGARSGIVDGTVARLVRRISRQRAGVPGRVGAAAVARDPDVRSTRDRGRDRMPSSLCGGAREAVRTGRGRYRDTRRVARGQC